MCGSEEGLAGFLDVLDVGDFEEAFGRVVEEPGQLGGNVGPFVCEDAGGLIIVAQLEGTDRCRVCGTSSARSARADK